MTRRWFGTDGVRARAGQGPLAAPFLMRLGQALGEQAVATSEGREAQVPMARDTRESGPAIVAALASGLAAAGALPLDLGVLPTPGLPLAMRRSGATRGLVVSASHNPWQDNGVKVFGPGGVKLDDSQERELEQRVAELGGEADDEGHWPPAAPRKCSGAPAYVEQLRAAFAGLDLRGLDLVVDCAHGAACATAPAVLGALGASVRALADAPDGRNINAGCGSTHLELLSNEVRAGGHALGLAFDGDADRVLFVDGAGRVCTGDAMLGLLGPWMDAAGRLPGHTVVATVMSNLGLEHLLASHGLQLLRAAVGDRHVLAAMCKGGFALGGEDSGHLLFSGGDDHPGDGLFTALKVLTALADTGATIASTIDALPSVPQVLLNLPVSARPPLEQLPALGTRARELEDSQRGELRVLLRYSGTQNLARVMVQGTDSRQVERVADELASLWRREIEALGHEVG